MPSIQFSARKAFIALAAISAMAVLAYYYFGLLVPGKGSELNSRGFRILTRLEQNVHEKKVNILKTIDLFSAGSERRTELFNGLALLRTDTVKEQKTDSAQRFHSDYDTSRNRWRLMLSKISSTGNNNTRLKYTYSYDINLFFNEILGFRKDFFEEYVILCGDSIIYQSRPLAYSGDTRQIFGRDKTNKHKLYSDFVERDTLAGKQYYAFYHPFDRSSDIRFVLCGLVSAEKYNRDKYLLNTDQVIWVSLLFLLAAFALPFIKVFTVSRFERLQHYDIIKMGAALIAGTSVASVAMLLLTYSKSEELRCRQAVKELNRSVQERMTSEIGQILAEIRWHEQNIENKATVYQNWIRKNKEADVNMSEPDVKDHFNQGESHHYTEVLLLIDSLGRSWAGWSGKFTTNPVAQLAEREYVKVFKSDHDDLFPYIYHAKTRDAAAQKYFIQPIYSWLDQQNMIMLSRQPCDTARNEIDAIKAVDTTKVGQRWREKKVLIMALETRLFSLMNAALPDEMTFCILDNRGNVLFHSDNKRNLRENFVEECSKAPFLRAAITGRMDTTLTLHYYGHDHYAYLAPMAGLPYTVVTLYDTSFLLEALTNQVTFSISMLILLGLVILSVFLAAHFLTRRLTFLKRQKINLRWLRYNPLNVLSFKRLSLYLLIPTALSVVFFGHRNLLFISFILPVLTLALTGAAIFVTQARGYRKSLYAARIAAQFRIYFIVCGVAAFSLFIALLYIYDAQISIGLWITGVAVNLLLMLLIVSPKRFIVIDRKIVRLIASARAESGVWIQNKTAKIRSLMAGWFRRKPTARMSRQRRSQKEKTPAFQLYVVVLPMMLLLYNLSVFPAQGEESRPGARRDLYYGAGAGMYAEGA